MTMTRTTSCSKQSSVGRLMSHAGWRLALRDLAIVGLGVWMVMVGSVLVVGVAEGAEPKDVADSVRREYLDRRSRAGVDATLHVDLALWCSDHDLEDESSFHLAMAVAHDPDNARARGLMGQVKHRGRWVDPATVVKTDRQDEQLAAKRAEYRRLRSRSGSTVADHERLAGWCFRQGLDVEGKAHLHALVGQDPSRVDVWRRLGYEQYRGQWLPREEIAARREEDRFQAAANEEWFERFEVLRKRLKKRSRDAREAAARRVDAELASIDDPRAVPATWVVWILGAEDRDDLRRGLDLLSRLATPLSSEYLAMISVMGNDPELRGRALTALRDRDAREFLPMLIESMGDPIRYRITPFNGDGSTAAIELEDPTARVLSLYQSFRPRDGGVITLGIAQGQSFSRMIFGGFIRSRDGAVPPTFSLRAIANSLEGAPTELRETINGIISRRADDSSEGSSDDQQSPTPQLGEGDVLFRDSFYDSVYFERQRRHNEALRQKLISDVAMVEAYNRNVILWNGRVEAVIALAVGEEPEQPQAELDGFRDVGVGPADGVGDGAGFQVDPAGIPAFRTRESYRYWWADQMGYLYEPPPRRQFVTTTAAPRVTLPPSRIRISCSCFAAGTLVAAREGLIPIDQVKVGDQVLSQDVDTGEIAYRAVRDSRQTRVAPTWAITTEDEVIEATDIHRFWVAGRGWVMARDLEPGDQLRSVGRSVVVASVSAGRQPVPVYNLEVVGTPTYFVGSSQVLVHDNTLPADPEVAFDQIAAESE